MINRVLIFMILFALISCKKDEIINPYDHPDLFPVVTEDSVYFNNPSSFSALHNNIFVPTCANSGCHDGSFEPDFRTIESSYNTLVYQPIIKNDPNNTYQYRVLPGNSEMSVMYKRLLIDIDGNSGIMPLSAEYDPEHYWHNDKEEHIQNIKNWIDSGAEDMFGNLPILPNKVPEMRGCIAFEPGQTSPLSRSQPRGTIYVPSNLNFVDIYFSVEDDLLASNQLSFNKLKYSSNILNFENKPFYDLEVLTNPIVETGFYQSTTDEFFHKYSLDVSQFDVGEVVFLKIFVDDNVNGVVEIPSNGSEYQIIKHFTLTII